MYWQPTTCDEAVRLLASEGGVLVAGGTDIYPSLVDRPPPERLIDLSRCSDLRGIATTPSHVRIGGATTWTDILRADLPRSFAGLAAAAREVGSIQIQNRATLGGNLCNASPAADGVPALLALDASVELTGPEGRRTLPLDAFVLGNRRTARRPDEILTAILVPRSLNAAGSAFVKLGARRYLVISIVMVAATILVGPDARISEARIAVGSASAAARRLRGLEARLVGSDPRTLWDRMSPEDFAELSPIDDVRATAAYRLDASRELVARAIDGAWEAAHA